MRFYRASWGKLLIGTSLSLTILCLCITAVVTQNANGVLLWLACSPVLLAIGCALFTVRGYTLRSDVILVHRLLWSTKLPRTDLTSVEFVPHVMRWSIRTFGNGGFFSFSGLYWSRVLGAYRAFVTDLRKTVVLHYRSRRPVVLSPDAPEDFVRDLTIAQ